MCVIIKREAGIIIPEEKLDSACKVNPDGMGFSVIDRGQIETIHIFEESGNNPKDLIKIFEDAKDKLIFSHLRYSTAGKKNAENCHPFQTFKGDEYELMFMHNGTMSSFKNGKDYSDTYHFNEQILKPLFKAFYEIHGPDAIDDPTIARILKEFKGASVFTLYDNNGKSLIIGEGVKYEGWWASNDYSFNRHHRASNNTYYGQAYGRTYNEQNKGKTEAHCNVTNVKKKEDTNVTPFSKRDCPATGAIASGTAAHTTDKMRAFGFALSQASKQGAEKVSLVPPQSRIEFKELASISDLSDIQYLSESEIYDLVNEIPLAATILIMDLIYLLWDKDRNEKKAKTNGNTAQDAAKESNIIVANNASKGH